MKRQGYSIKVRRDSDGAIMDVAGRPGWFLQQLLDHPAGITTMLLPPGVRASHFAWILRKRHGLLISTDTEAHGGEFAGHHGRYSLAEPLTLLSTTGEATNGR